MDRRRHWFCFSLKNISAGVNSAIVLFVLTASALGCSQVAQQSNVPKVGMILGSGVLGDRCFNDSADNGLLQAQKKFDIRFETVDFTNKDSNLDALRLFARNEYDLIIGIGFENQENIVTVAKEFPHTRFAIIDVAASGNNIASIVYREHEGDFLMGVLAAMVTRSKMVGVIGGMDIDSIRRIEKGFIQGAKYQDSGITVLTNIAGTFSDPQIGKILALGQYDRGVDVIHNAAGRTGLGIIEAARQTGKWTTGTSGDQRYLAPDNVVGNRPKRVDTAVMTLIEEVKTGTFKSGTRSLGLKEDGITLGPFNEALVSKEMLGRMEDLRQKIISGEIVIQVE